jgi:drug/metabolite transporter (DMT)-like permease
MIQNYPRSLLSSFTEILQFSANAAAKSIFTVDEALTLIASSRADAMMGHAQYIERPPVIPSTTPISLRTASLTALAMLAFAANSILCRLALGSAAIDAASFTAVRLCSAALALWLIVALALRQKSSGDWTSAAMLFLYALTFSLAYLRLTAATGALILFAAVQLTMIAGGLRGGEHPSPREWAGLVLALGGLVALLLPGLSAPPLSAALLMTVAGVAWGIYSLRGRGASGPMATTAGNFLLAAPLSMLALLIALPHIHLSPTGLLLATVSGALASGPAYIVWYAALRGLTATRGATVQLSVPVLAAGGGIVFLGESLSLRWLLCTAAVLGGIALALRQRMTFRKPNA